MQQFPGHTVPLVFTENERAFSVLFYFFYFLQINLYFFQCDSFFREQSFERHPFSCLYCDCVFEQTPCTHGHFPLFNTVFSSQHIMDTHVLVFQTWFCAALAIQQKTSSPLPH